MKKKNNTLSINNSTFNIFDSVSTGLTNVGTGAAIAAGLKAGDSIAKAYGLSPTAEIGVLVVGAIIGGYTVTIANVVGSIYQKKIDSSVADLAKSNTTTSISPPTSDPGNGGSEAYSIEPSAFLDIVMFLVILYYSFQV